MGCVDPPEEPTLKGVWEGQYRDEIAHWPLPMYMIFDNDSLVHSMKNSDEPTVEPYEQFGEYLKIDTVLWEVKKINAKELILENEEGLFVFKRNNEYSLLEDSIEYFYQQYWKTIVDNQHGLIEELSFYGDNDSASKAIKRYFYQNKLVHEESLKTQFAISNFKQQYFITQTNLTQNKDTISESIQLILRFNKTKIKTQNDYFQVGKVFDSSKPFVHCKNTRPRLFQDSQLKYKGGKMALEKYFLDNYEWIETDESGFITIRFTVNCQGEVGDLELEQINSESREVLFDYEIINQLLNITAQTPNWIPAKNEDGEPTDARAVLIFKMKQGTLIEVLP